MSDFMEIHSPINITVAGDLNIIFDPKEKRGGVWGKDPLQEVVEYLIQVRDLLDFKPKKGWFTWTNNRVGVARFSAQLDRFLVQISLLDGNILISTKILPKLTSDHHPISLLLQEEENLGPIPFRFSPLWIEREGFWEIVTQVWSQFVEGSPSFVLEQKLKHTKYALKNWIKTPLTNPTRSREAFVQDLVELQLSTENSEISKL